MRPALYSARDYKGFLKLRLSTDSPFPVTQAALAKAAGCRPSYLSQCLNGKVHLLPEQAHAVGVFLKLPDDEASFFGMLVEHDRSGSEPHRQALRRKMNALRESMVRISNRLERDEGATSADSSMDAYYSSWTNIATHILCTIPKIKGSREVAERLGITVAQAERSIRTLRKLGLIEESEGRLHATNRHMRITDSHPSLTRHHSNWRMISALRPQPASSEDLHYTAVYSLSREDAALIREELANAMLKVRERVKSSPEERVFAFTLDWFSLA